MYKERKYSSKTFFPFSTHQGFRKTRFQQQKNRIKWTLWMVENQLNLKISHSLQAMNAQSFCQRFSIQIRLFLAIFLWIILCYLEFIFHTALLFIFTLFTIAQPPRRNSYGVHIYRKKYKIGLHSNPAPIFHLRSEFH